MRRLKSLAPSSVTCNNSEIHSRPWTIPRASKSMAGHAISLWNRDTRRNPEMPSGSVVCRTFRGWRRSGSCSAAHGDGLEPNIECGPLEMSGEESAIDVWKWWKWHGDNLSAYARQPARGPSMLAHLVARLAYVGVCWPIVRAMWAHLVAMLAYVGLMLTHVEPKDPKNGNRKKTL